MKVLDALEQTIPAQIFRAEVFSWVKCIGVKPKEIRIRKMNNKWAGCSSNGRLTFNTEILRQLGSFRVEAILYELIHLKLPNYGKLFKNLMEVFLPIDSDSLPISHQRNTGVHFGEVHND